METDSAAILVYRRYEQGFVPEVYKGLKAIVPLPEVGITLPLIKVYEAVDFASQESTNPAIPKD